jgi:hypothetical protein
MTMQPFKFRLAMAAQLGSQLWKETRSGICSVVICSVVFCSVVICSVVELQLLNCKASKFTRLVKKSIYKACKIIKLQGL